MSDHRIVVPMSCGYIPHGLDPTDGPRLAALAVRQQRGRELVRVVWGVAAGLGAMLLIGLLLLGGVR